MALISIAFFAELSPGLKALCIPNSSNTPSSTAIGIVNANFSRSVRFVSFNSFSSLA